MELERAGEEPARYAALVDRAVEFIVSRGGSAPEDMLLRHVFGTTTSPSLWSNLLTIILRDDPRVEREPGGVWTTGRELRAGTALSDFVVVDVETTGLKSRRNRIIEIAILSVSERDEVRGWSTLVNPERRIPDQITRVTGISNTDVALAPSFRSIAPTILELIASRPIVGHNVGFDVSFLNAELQRTGYPKLVNLTIDTMSLADSMMENLRRLSLDAIARQLGIPHNQAHRVMSDAEATLAVFWALRERMDKDEATLERLHGLSSSKRRGRRGVKSDVARGRSILDADLLDGMPHAPGVYIMRDRNQRVIYVGKAKDLRKRVSSYFSHPLGYTRKMDGLLESIAQIQIEVVGTELAALVLESQLIRRYRPRFNRQQRNAEQYVYVRVDVANPWPTVTLSKDWADDGARYFGPFRSERQVRDAVRLINDVLPLRTCRRTFRDARSLGSPCIDYSLKRCAGPCIGMADPDDYVGAVRMVIRFFEGERSELLELLHDRLERAAAALDFERAARLRDQIRRLDGVSLEQASINNLRLLNHALLVMSSVDERSREVWYLVSGRRWAELRIEHDECADDLSRRLEQIRRRAESQEASLIQHHHTIDEASILARWLRSRDCRDSLVFWQPGQSSLDVARLTLQAHPLTDDAPEIEEIDEHVVGEPLIAEDGVHGAGAGADYRTSS